MGLFSNVKTLATNMAQILLVLFILPVTAFIFDLFYPNSSSSFVISWLGEIPLCGVLADILSQYVKGISASDIPDITITALVREFPEALLVGIFVHLFNQIFCRNWTIMGFKKIQPLPILPSFLGLFAATLFVNLVGLTKNDMMTLIIEFGTIVIMLIGIRFMLKGFFGKRLFGIKKILVLIIDGIFAIIVSLYITTLMLLMGNSYASVGEAIAFIAPVAVVTVIAAVIVFFVRMGQDADKDII